MIRLFCITLALVPTIAMADVWDAYLQRCLIPMELILQPDSSGLKLVSVTDGRSSFDIERGTLIVSGTAPDSPTQCSVISRDDGAAEIANQFLAWSGQPQNIDRYTEIDLGDGALTLRSVEWREPQLELSMLFTDDDVQLSARDTDLES